MKNEGGHRPIEHVSLCLSCSKYTEVLELVNSDLSDGVCGFVALFQNQFITLKNSKNCGI